MRASIIARYFLKWALRASIIDGVSVEMGPFEVVLQKLPLQVILMIALFVLNLSSERGLMAIF